MPPRPFLQNPSNGSRLARRELIALRSSVPVTSIALRATGGRQAVIDAVNSGEIVRTGPQRGTLHVVGADRVRDLLVVARERTFPQTVRRSRELGIDEDMLERARDVVGTTVVSGITRTEAVEAWKQAGLATEQGKGLPPHLPPQPRGPPRVGADGRQGAETRPT